MTQAILIDVMSTVVYDPFYKVMPAFFGLELAELIAQKQPDSWRLFEEGVRDEAWFLENFFVDGRSFDAEALKRRTFEAYAWLPGMKELCRELHENGVVLHFFSNYSDWFQEIENRLGLSRYGQWTFVSCEQGLRKPDRAAFERALELSNLPAQGTVFVDDNQTNIETANAMGLVGHHFQSADPLRNELKARGLLD